MAQDTPVFLAGLRGTGDFGADERPKNFREAILWLDPNGMTPITALTAKTATESTDDPEFAWWEETMAPKTASIASTATGSGPTTHTALTVTDPGPESAGVFADNPAQQFKAGDLLLVNQVTGETTQHGSISEAPLITAGGNEIVKVLSLSGNVITVIRNYANSVFGGTEGTDASPTAGVGVTLAATDRLVYIGSAYEEGSTSPDAVFSQPSKSVNYTQIFKTAFELTGTAKQTKTRTGDAWNNDRKRAMFKHSEALEQALIWGVRREKTGPSGERLRLTDGIRAMLNTNVNVSVGAVTDDFIFDTLSPLFNFNAGGAGDQRVCFLGNSALNAMQKAHRDSNPLRINYQGVVKYYGMKLLEFTIPQGTLMMKTHPLMNVDPIYSKAMFVLNPKGLIRRPLAGRDTKVQQNIQANDADKRKDQWLTEVGFELHFERTQGYYSGITY